MEANEEGTQTGKRAFVTVGTTLFDALVEAVDSAPVLQWLAANGYTHLDVQVGKGTYAPTFSAVAELGLPLQCSWYTYKPNLRADMQKAQLIISHGGAGSIMEGLGMGGKHLVVVVNDLLMGNHQLKLPNRLSMGMTMTVQEELARALEARKYLAIAVPTAAGLLDTLQGTEWSTVQPYPAGNPQSFALVVDEALQT